MKVDFFLKDSSQDLSRTLKNILFLNLSTIFINLIAFITSVIIGRYLESQDFGKFVFIFAFLAIFDIFTDLGLSQLAIRDISQDRNSAARYLVNISFLKLILCIVTIFFIWSVTLVSRFSWDIKAGLLIIVLSIILESFGHFFGSLFNAFERMDYTAIFSFLLKFFNLIGVYLIIKFHLSLIPIFWTYVFSATIFTLMSLIYLRTKFIPVITKLDITFCKEIILKGLPFALFMFSFVIYTRVDVLLLKIMKGDYACAIYGAANYILMAIMFIPANLSTVLYPVFSRLYSESKIDELGQIYKRYFFYLLILALPIGLGITLLSERFILLIWTKYSEASTALKILVWGTAIQYLTSILTFLMFAAHRQKIATLFIFLLCIFNILLNLILVPNYSYIGSSIASSVSMFLYFVLLFTYISKYIYKIKLESIMIKPILATIFMGGFIYFFQRQNLLFLILSAAFIYISFLFLTGVFKYKWISQSKSL